MEKLGGGFGKAGTAFTSFISGFAGGAAFSLLDNAIGSLTSTITSIPSKLSDAADANADYERTLLGLDAQLRSAGAGVGFTRDELVSFASDLGEATLTSEEAVLRASRALLSFRTVQGDTFTRAVTISQDLAETLGGDLESNIIQVGKALEDPVKGVTALARSGTQFTEQQREQIRVLVESGDQLGAQNLILSELERQYAGTAVAAAQGLEGLKDTLGELINDGTRAIGGALSPAFEGFNELLINIVEGLGDVDLSGLLTSSERLKAVLSDNPELAERITEAIARLAQEGVDQLGGLLDAVTAFVSEEDNVEAIAEVIDRVAIAINAAGKTARFLIALAEGFIQINQEARNLPIIGDDLETAFSPVGPVLGVVISRFRDLIGLVVRIRSELNALQNGYQALEEGQALGGQTLNQAADRLGEASGILFDASQKLGENASQGLAQTEESAKSLEEQLADLDDATQRSLDTASKAETERVSQLRRGQTQEIAELRKQLEAGQISVEQFEERRAAISERFNDGQREATLARIRAEINAEQQKTAELERLGGEGSEEKIRESKLRTAELTDELLSQELDAEQAAADRALELQQEAKEAAISAISERVSAQKAAVDEEVRQIERVEQALESANSALERRQQLLSARSGLQDAIGGLQQTAFDVLIDTTDDPEEQAKLREQAAQAELEALDRAQSLELAEFDLKQKGLEIESLILQARLRGQIAENRGAQIEVVRATDQGNKGVVVSTVVRFPGDAPVAVDWQVSDRSGSPKMFNLFIEGISMLSTERSEIGALLAQNRNSIDALLADLQTRG